MRALAPQKALPPASTKRVKTRLVLPRLELVELAHERRGDGGVQLAVEEDWPVGPGQKRLISYGIDLQTLIDSDETGQTSRIVSAKVVKGVLELQSFDVQDGIALRWLSYTIDTCLLTAALMLGDLWDDLSRGTAMMANLLQSLDLTPDARVAVHADKSVESLMLYLAVLRAGHVFLPLNTAYQAGEIEYFIGNAEPAVVVWAAQMGTVTFHPWHARKFDVFFAGHRRPRRRRFRRRHAPAQEALHPEKRRLSHRQEEGRGQPGIRLRGEGHGLSAGGSAWAPHRVPHRQGPSPAFPTRRAPVPTAAPSARPIDSPDWPRRKRGDSMVGVQASGNSRSSSFASPVTRRPRGDSL